MDKESVYGLVSWLAEMKLEQFYPLVTPYNFNVDNWVILGWDVDQWDCNLYATTQKDSQKFAKFPTMFSSIHKSQPNSKGKTMSDYWFTSLCFQPFKSTAKFKWEYNVRCVMTVLHLIAEPNRIAVEVTWKVHGADDQCRSRFCTDYYSNCEDLDNNLCMLSWTCTLYIIT
jgi:hypothetical protein